MLLKNPFYLTLDVASAASQITAHSAVLGVLLILGGILFTFFGLRLFKAVSNLIGGVIVTNKLFY